MSMSNIPTPVLATSKNASGSAATPICLSFVVSAVPIGSDICHIVFSYNGILFEQVDQNNMVHPVSLKNIQITTSTLDRHHHKAIMETIQSNNNTWKYSLPTPYITTTATISIDVEICPPEGAIFNRITNIFVFNLTLKSSKGTAYTRSESLELFPTNISRSRIVLYPFSTPKQSAHAVFLLEDRFKNWANNTLPQDSFHVHAKCISDENQNSGTWLSWHLRPKNKRTTNLSSVHFMCSGLNILYINNDVLGSNCHSNACFVSKAVSRTINIEWIAWINCETWNDVKLICSHDSMLGTAIGSNIISINTATNDKNTNINKLERVIPYNSNGIFANPTGKPHEYELFKKERLLDREPTNDMYSNHTKNTHKALNSERAKIACMGKAYVLEYYAENINVLLNSSNTDVKYMCLSGLNDPLIRHHKIKLLCDIWRTGIKTGLLSVNQFEDIYAPLTFGNVVYNCLCSGNTDNTTLPICILSYPDPVSMFFTVSKTMFPSNVIHLSDKPGLLYNRHISCAVSINTSIVKASIIRGCFGSSDIKIYNLPFTPNSNFIHTEFDDDEDLNNVIHNFTSNNKNNVFYIIHIEGEDNHFVISSPIWIEN